MVTGAVAAIGNFDGVHLGHQRLLAETAAFAADRGAPVGAVVFDPHPRRFFRPNDPPFLLTTPEKRNELLRAHGASEVFSLTFDAALAAMTPDEFVYEVLKGRLHLAGVVTGTEFRFGKGRAGDAAALKSLCENAGIAAKAIAPNPEAPGGEKISSSAIRAALQKGEAKEAAAMLGRPWVVEGAVLAGEKRGRMLGFPTANMTLGELARPRCGVYVVEATAAGKSYGGVANFGRRPTVGGTAPLLETHLFDFKGDLYGARLEVRFLEFLRDEQKFDGLDALKAQIAADAAEAKRRLTLFRKENDL